MGLKPVFQCEWKAELDKSKLCFQFFSLDYVWMDGVLMQTEC